MIVLDVVSTNCTVTVVPGLTSSRSYSKVSLKDTFVVVGGVVMIIL